MSTRKKTRARKETETKARIESRHKYLTRHERQKLYGVGPSGKLGSGRHEKRKSEALVRRHTDNQGEIKRYFTLSGKKLAIPVDELSKRVSRT